MTPAGCIWVACTPMNKTTIHSSLREHGNRTVYLLAVSLSESAGTSRDIRRYSSVLEWRLERYTHPRYSTTYSRSLATTDVVPTAVNRAARYIPLQGCNELMPSAHHCSSWIQIKQYNNSSSTAVVFYSHLLNTSCYYLLLLYIRPNEVYDIYIRIIFEVKYTCGVVCTSVIILQQ